MSKTDKNNVFSKWDNDLIFMRDTLAETLKDLKMPELAKSLPWGESKDLNISLPLSERAIQVYSLCFQILNMVEENTANQTRRIKGYSSEGLWSDVFKFSKENRISSKNLENIFSKIELEPVLTAHPTEAKRATVLEHHRNLYLKLVKSENKMWSENERKFIKEEIKGIFECLLRTGDLYLERPEVEDELRNITYYLKTIFPSALRVLFQRYFQAWEDSYDSNEKTDLSPPPFPNLKFGTWVGGDRDGHPFVNHNVTQKTLITLREIALDNTKHLLTNLTKFLSLNDRHQNVPDILKTRTNELLDICGSYGQEAIKRNPGEPWRQYLNLLILRTPTIDDSSDYKYRYSEELIKDLEIFNQSLLQIGSKRLSKLEVEPVIQIIKSFGFHLATLDIRQNSDYHDEAISQLLKASGEEDYNFKNWSKEKRIIFLNKELENKRPFISASLSAGSEADEIRKTYTVILEHGSKFGYSGIGSLIVSMTRDLSDLLSVYVLAKEANLAFFDSNNLICPLPVVPLFETIDDLKSSTKVTEQFIKHPVSINSRQYQSTNLSASEAYQIMIGYSDSSKDGGVLSSYWNLYKTQSNLYQLSLEKGIPFRFFHGRGGTISRGAGPTDRFLSALPPGSLSSGLRMTEQGETISQKYANLLTASYNLELLHAGTALYTLKNSIASDNETFLPDVMDQLSELSQNKYQSLLQKENFIPFYRQVTPIDIIEQSRFGSRPSKRKGLESLDDLRAIPWVFSWNQSRFFLSSWYGVGSALLNLKTNESSQWNKLSKDINSNAPAKYIFTNIESSLYSASENFMIEYSKLVVDESVRKLFMEDIIDEFKLTHQMITELFKSELKDRRPRLYRTLSYRHNPLEALHRTQILLLEKWRQKQDEDTLTQLLLATNAIAGGLRTTG